MRLSDHQAAAAPAPRSEAETSGDLRAAAFETKQVAAADTKAATRSPSTNAAPPEAATARENEPDHDPPNGDTATYTGTAKPELPAAPAAFSPQDSGTPTEPGASPFATLELGPAVIRGKGDLGFAPQILASAAVFFTEELRSGAFVLLPVGSVGHEATFATSETRISMGGADVRWQRAAGTLRPFAGLGFLAAHFAVRGEARAPRVGGTEATTMTYGGLGRIGLGIVANSRVRITAQALGGIQHRHLVIHYWEDRAARWGPYWGALAGSVEAYFD